MNSRTNLRLSLQREQSIQEECKGFLSQSQSILLNSQCTSTSSASSSSIPINASSIGSYHHSTSNSMRNSPINIINHTMPIGNRHFNYPQITHVQAEITEEMGRKNLTLSNSLPPGLNAQNSPPKNLRFTENGLDSHNHQNNVYQHQYQGYTVGSRRNSPSELSPTGFADSPTSASFTSAQSELDDVIIDEILSMEEEQKLRDGQHNSNNQLDKHFTNSYSYADNLSGLLHNDNFGFSRISYNRQVSNSAPTSTLDIEGLVRDELYREQDNMRDRRKKDVHNMIERRRRYNINDRIKELGTLLPKSEEMKMNKGTILKASVDYIRLLRKEQDRISHVHQKQQLLEVENKKMLQRIQDLELQLKTHGVPLPMGGFTSAAQSIITSSVDRLVKSEPVDDNEPPTPLAMMHSQMATNPLSPYHAQNNLTALPPPSSVGRDYDPPLNGRNFGLSTGSEVRPTYYASVPYSSANDMFSCIDSVLSSSNDHYNQYKPHRDLRMPEMILDLGCENLNTPGLMSSMDPLISAAAASRLINTQAPSPDIHWDASTFSPEGAMDKMDFISS